MLNFLEILDKKSDDCNEQRLELRQVIKQLEDNTKEKDNRIQSLNDKLNQVKIELSRFISLIVPVYASYRTKNDNNELIWPLILSVSDEVPDQGTPAFLKMSGFASNRMLKKSWNSSFFYTYEGEYQMRLRVDAAGFGDGEGTHVSIGLYLMNDDKIEESQLPLIGTFTVELLNQLNDSCHHSDKVNINQYAKGDFTKTITEGTRGWEISQFISYTLLTSSNHAYLKDDALYFRISYQRYDLMTKIFAIVGGILGIIFVVILIYVYSNRPSTANSRYS